MSKGTVVNKYRCQKGQLQSTIPSSNRHMNLIKNVKRDSVKCQKGQLLINNRCQKGQ